MFDAVLRLAEELAAVRALLADPAITSVRLVLTPEAVVTAEARRTFTALALYGYQVDEVVANRVFPAAAGRLGLAAGLGAAPSATQLAAIGESFAGLPVRRASATGRPSRSALDALRGGGRRALRRRCRA